MDTGRLMPLVDDLESNIDDLEEALAPVLKQSLSASTGKLPLLDKAKLYTLATYAIESVLFSSLRLNGVEAKSHPITRELGRVKEYYGKIKTAETATQKRTLTVDKDAAGRFIKAGLAGNEKYDQDRKQRQDAQKAEAKRKLDDLGAAGTHTHFESDKEEGEGELGSKRASKRKSEDYAAKKVAKRQRKEKKQSRQQASDDQAEQSNPTSAAEGDTTPRLSKGRSRKRSQKVPQSGHDAFQRLLKAPESQKKDDNSKQKTN